MTPGTVHYATPKRASSRKRRGPTGGTNGLHTVLQNWLGMLKGLVETGFQCRLFCRCCRPI